MNVVEPRPNPETVEALLDVTWRVVTGEVRRTEALDRKAATVATFASLIAALTATVGIGSVRSVGTWWAFGLFVMGLAALTSSLVCAVRLLWPREYAALGTEYVRRFPTWGEILKSPEQVRGETMTTLVEVLALERAANDEKSGWLRMSFGLLAVGLAFIGLEGVILGFEEVR